MENIERCIFYKLKVGIVYLNILLVFILCRDRVVVQAQEAMPSNPKVLDGVTTWDCIYFGNFPQKDRKGKKQPIKWRVLYVEGSDAFLISDHILYHMDFVTKDGMDVNWENNNIRAWLNSYDMDNFERALNIDDDFYNNGFLNIGFSEQEKNAIIKQNLGDDCNDYIYLPSKEEMLTSTYGFSSDEDKADFAKKAQSTPFDEERGLGYIQECVKTDCYYLRNFSQDPVYVNEGLHMDEIHRDGTYSPTSFWIHGLGVRPVLHLDLSKKVWSNAGTIRSDIVVEKTSGDYEYYIYDDEAVISAYNGTEISISIPETLDGYPVGYVSWLDESSDIEESNEEDNEDKPDTLQSVIFPDSVWGIGYLGQDNLVSVTLGSGLEIIKSWIFSGCETLESIIIPSGVEEIGYDAFSYCINLKSINIPSSVKEIGSSAFSGCTSLETINLSSGVEKIGYDAFSYCINLKSINIPSSVKEIDDGAFTGCAVLKSINIPSGVIKIGEDVFSDVGDDFVMTVTKGSTAEEYAKKNKIRYVYSDGSKPTEIKPKGNGVIDSSVPHTKNQESIIGNDLTNNGSETANQNEEKNKDRNGAEVKDVGEAFTVSSVMFKVSMAGDEPEVEYVRTVGKEMTKVVIPDTVSIDGVTYAVTCVSKGAFKNNKKLKSVTIGKNVEIIDNSAFYSCTSLTRLIFKTYDLESIGDDAFANCTGLASVTIPKGMKSIGKRAFAGCKKLKKVIIKSNELNKIGKNAFKGIRKNATFKCPKKCYSKYKKLLKKSKLAKTIKIK